ncbi:MAG TPA: VanW family protein [Candidatus Limnocylindrales bacterium]|nr:VanW family protein [Candidatus Limnocylindrales bacterium]
MTDETFEPTTTRPRPRAALRFAIAFLVGLIAAMALGVGALYAYDQQYQGRVLPGVRVADIDLAGLTREEAVERVAAAYTFVGDGAIQVNTPDGPLKVPYRLLQRRVDAEALVDAALGVGRSGSAVDRVIAGARTAMRGASIEPTVSFDAEAVARNIERLARTLDRDPVDAFVATTDKGFELTEGSDGRTSDASAAIEAALSAVGELDAPEIIEVDLETSPVEPAVTTADAEEAKATAERIAEAVYLQRDDKQVRLNGSRIRGWISFGVNEAGAYAPIVNTKKLPNALKKLAKKINVAARSASYKTSGAKITGVIPSRDGKAMDVKATAAEVEALLANRAAGTADADELNAVMTVVRPKLTTSQARAVIPKMRKISEWTTYFPIAEKNGFGANIWIPAMDLDGHVVAPGDTFDFWNAIGPVTRERGYRDGGAIINGRTELQGALAGGICSTSTTLFNAALRAGYEMGARRNHYYYIDRYPMGLDATVFKSGSSTQTMEFTNDTRYPVLIRAYKIRNGSSGYVKFALYSVPTGRKVSFSKPVVKNFRPATDTIQYTSSLPKGASERVEFPVDGMQVWVTRTVRKNGEVIHKETYFSNYARITGITLVGR